MSPSVLSPRGRWLRAAALALIVLAPACSSAPADRPPAPTFPVSGSAADLKGLEGRWEGEYSSAETGRSGTIVFEFRNGEGSGDVLMMPKGSTEPLRPNRHEAVADTLRTMPAVLTIRFAQASGGALVGDLAPYVDPDCECEARTTFHGRRSGDAIEGSFTSTTMQPSERRVSGKWNVSRSNRKPEKLKTDN
ncbi:MAG: hypothetical protein M3S32_02785 [Acidobacteriota bacterium]|nr:hypothetical protein [Acidobacteriota bacterium]